MTINLVIKRLLVGFVVHQTDIGNLPGLKKWKPEFIDALGQFINYLIKVRDEKNNNYQD